MAIEPSPTPDATRLIDPDRTSPAAKMPGTLDSSKKGERSKGQPGEDLPFWVKSGPVTINP
jgi:hypothetical protein